MSDGLLDERVVEMRFDNADFERNVNQSIKTIDKLKESLDFDNAGDSFESISAAAAKCDVSPLEESLEGISVKFNMLEMVAANVLGNITSKIVDAGVRLGKSLTVDQLTAGWQKYDQKTAAVQTIMSATGESIDVINQKLEKLIWFADETSYDFVDMVNNIGKFTSAGVDLDTAVDSMMGISNWAAASGAGIQQASRAMYNLSQAIGMGYVGLTDWRSIELANMATKEFKETVIATALDMGTLQQATDGTVKTLSGKFEVTAENMRNSLKEQWFSTDVLNSALAAYNEFANVVKARQEQWAEEHDGQYKTVSQTIEILKEEGYAMDTLGAKAFMRAQEATKFSEAVAATADAVSSGWMRTFEIIFGNYEQAKKLWTDLANDMYDVFASGNEHRNEKLSDMMHSNYQKMLDEMPDGSEMNERLYEKLYELTKSNLGTDYADRLFGAYDSLEDLLKDNANLISESSLSDAMDAVATDFRKEADTALKLSKQLKNGSFSLKQAVMRLVSGQYGTELEAQKKAVEQLGFDYETLSALAEQWKAGIDIPWDEYQKELIESLDDQFSYYRQFVKKIDELVPEEGFLSKLTEMGGRDKLIGGVQNVIDTFKNLYLTIVEIKNGIDYLMGDGSFLEKLIDGFYNLTSVLNYSDEAFSYVQESINDLFHGGLQEKWSRFWHGFDIKDTLTEGQRDGSAYWDSVAGKHIPGMLDHIFGIYKDHLSNLPEDVAKSVERIRTEIFTFFGTIPQKISDLKTKIFGEFHIKKVLNVATGQVDNVITHTGGLLNGLKDRIRSLGDGLGGKIFDGMLATIKKVADFLFGYKAEDGTPIEGAFVKIYDKATALWQKLKDIGKVISDIFHKFADWLGFHEIGIFNPDTKEIESKWIRTYGVIDKVKQSVVDAFTTIAKWLGFDFGAEEHGINIILGIFNGIIEGIKNIRNWIKAHIFDPFVEGFKSVFGIHSPAKEMEPLGEKIFLGILAGILNVAKSVGSWIKNHIFIPIKNALTSLIKEFLDNTAVGSYIEKVKEKFQGLKKLIEKFSGSAAIKSVKKFLLGEKDSEGNIVKHNIFGKIGTAINILKEKIVGIRDSFLNFFFGPVNEEGKRTENLFKRLPGYFEKAKTEIKTFFLGDKSKGIDNFFVRIKNGINNIIKDRGYTSIHDFIFGNSKIGLDNIFIRSLDAAKKKFKELSKSDFGKTVTNSLDLIKKKFEELKAAHPWLQSMCDFVDKGIEKIKDKLGISGKGLSGVIETISNVFTKVWNKVQSIKDSLFKKDQKSIFESLWEFITGPAKFLQGINKTAKIIVEALAGLSVILLATSIDIGGLEITSPFQNLAGTVKDFAISVAIIAAVLVGVPALVSKLGIEQSALSQTALALAGIMAILVGCAKILEGADHQLSLSDIIKVQINTIPTLKAISSIILEIAAIAVVFALMAKFVGKDKVQAGVEAISSLLFAIGICLALFHLPEIIHGTSANVKSRAGELFGVAAILWMLGNFLIKFAIAIGAIAVIAQSVQKDERVLTHFYIILGLVIASVAGIFALLNSFTGKSINASIVLTLALLLAIIVSIGGVISTLAIIARKNNGLRSIITAVGSIAVILIGITHLVKSLSGANAIDLSAIVTLGTLRYVLTGIGGVLEQVALVSKKAGAGNTWSAVGSIVVILGVLIGAIAILNAIDVSMDILAKIGALALLLGGLGGILILLFKLQNSLGVKVNPKDTLTLIASIGEMVLAIVGLGIIFGLLGQVAEGLNSGFGALAGMVLKTVGIVALVMVLVGVIGGIAKAIDSKLGDNSSLDAINYFGELLESVFNALGKAVGAVIGGLGEGLTDSLPKISQNISDFVTKLDPFIEKVGSLEDKHLKGAGILTGILLAVAADTVIANITALATLFSGGVSPYVIGTNMSNLIEKLQTFLAEVVKLDESHVKGARYFTRLLINIGIQTFIAALTNIAGMFAMASPYTVGANMSNLIEKLGPFINAVKDINENHVKGAGYFTSLLISVGKQLLISSIDNLIALCGGSRNFTKMFSTLSDDIAPGVTKFSSALTGVTLDKVERASKILPVIFDMLTNDQYRGGGIAGFWDWITKGEVDYEAMFSSLNTKILPGLRDFATGVNAVDDAGEKMDYSHVGEAAAAIKAVMDIMSISTKGMISDEDGSNGIFGWFSKPSSAEQLENSFGTINSTVVPAIFGLQKALKTVSEDGEKIDPTYIQQVIGSFSGLLEALSDFRDIGFSEEDASQIGSYIIEGLANALNEGASRVKTAAENVAKNVRDGLTLTLEIKSPSKVAYRIGAFVAEGLTNGLRAGEGMTWSMAQRFGEGTIKALEEGLGDFDSVSQHAINMVTMDLLDENRFDMKDFAIMDRMGNMTYDFDKMRKFLTNNFGQVFDQSIIDGFVNSYEQEMNKINDTINDKEYAETILGIGTGDFGLSENTIIDALTKELGSVDAARQAWEDYNDVKEGNLKINQDILKQQKQNPPMTLEQYEKMLAHEQEGFEKANSGYFDELARQNGTTRAEEIKKAGYDPTLIQNRLNQGGMSQELIEAYIKSKALNEALVEQNRLIDEIIRKGKDVQDPVNDVNDLTDSVEELNESLDFDIDDPLGEKLAIKDTKQDAKALDEVAEAAENVAEAQQNVAETAEAKAEAVAEETKAVEASNRANQDSTKFNRNGMYYQSLNKTELGGAVKTLREGKKLTEEQVKMLLNAQQAVFEGAFGETNFAANLQDWGLSDVDAKYLEKFAISYKGTGEGLEEYVKWASYGADANEKLTESNEKVTESTEKVSTALENSPEYVQKFAETIVTGLKGAVDKGVNTFDVNAKEFLEQAGEGFDVQELLDYLKVDKIEDIKDSDKITFEVSDFISGWKDLSKDDLDKLLSMDVLGNSIAATFGDLFGNNKELGQGDFFGQMLELVTNPGSTDWSNEFLGVLGTIWDSFRGINKEAKETNDTEINPKVNTSEVESAISMAEALKQQYTLGDNEKTLAAQGIKDLQNGVKVTQQEADAIQKLWDGCMIGLYESGEDRIKAIQQLLKLDNFDWEDLSSLLDENGHFDISKQTNTAMDQAKQVNRMIEAGEKYSTADLMNDIYAGKWGYDTDRLKALEEAGYDAQKVQEEFLKWYDGDKSVENLGDDYLRISEAEKEVNAQTEKMNSILNQTPEGAFRSIADFLDGVEKAIEKEDTAERFHRFITSVVNSMKELDVSKASEFEKLAGFLSAVRTSAKESATLAKDFKVFVEGIKDSVQQLGEIDIENTEGMEKVTEFLNNIKIENKDTLDSVTGFINNIIEFATGANAGGDYSTKLIDIIGSIQDAINNIDIKPEKTDPMTDFLDKLTDSAGILKDGGVVQEFLDNFYNAFEDSKDKAATVAALIVEAIKSTFKSKYKDFQGVGYAFVWYLSRGILSGKGPATTAAQSIAGVLMNTLKDQAVTKASQSGSDFVNNFISGMTSPEAQGQLQDALDNLFNPNKQEPKTGSKKMTLKSPDKLLEPEETEEPSVETETSATSAGTKYGQQFIQDMTTVISNSSETVGLSIDNMFGGITEATGSITGLGESATKAFEELASAITDALENEEQGGLKDVVGKLKSMLAGIAPDGYSMGRETALGLVKGMAENSQYVAKASALLAQGVVFTYEDIMKIQSPSRLMAKLGHYTVEGLIVGIHNTQSELIHEVSNTAGGMIDQFSAAVAAASEIAEEEMHDPVIRPVIDMSDVYDSAGKIDAALSSDKAMSISAAENAKADALAADQNSSAGAGSQTFIQNNYSPKALSRLEIYRQTKNQFAMIKGVNKQTA